MATAADLDNWFTHHPPAGDQPERYQKIRQHADVLAYWINELCPESPEKSLAMTNLRQAVMWANASIACNEPPPSPEQETSHATA